jgi:MFS family permease
MEFLVPGAPTWRELVRFRGYSNALIDFVVYGTGIGAVYFTAGPLIAAVVPGLHFSLTQISYALLIRGLVSMAAAPCVGWLVKHFSARSVIIGAGVATAVLTGLVATVHTIIAFDLFFGAALGISDAGLGPIPVSANVTEWFMENRSMALGVVIAGAGVGGGIFAPLMTSLINGTGSFRTAMVILGAIILVLTVGPALWLARRPRDVNQWVDNVEGRTIPEVGEVDAVGERQHSFGRVLRSPTFWAIFLVFGVEAWALGVYADYQIIYLKTQGVGSLASSGALGASAWIAAGTGFFLGRVNDRITPYYTLIFSVLLMLAGSIAFLGAKSAGLMWLYAIVFGAGYGLLVPTVPAIVARYFGAKEFALGYANGYWLVGLMGSMGPWATGQIVGSTHSFTFPIHLVTYLLSGALVVSILAVPPLASGLRRGMRVRWRVTEQVVEAPLVEPHAVV